MMIGNESIKAGDLLGSAIPQAWLPNETLFSLCSRHHCLSGNYLAATTCQQLFGHRNQGSAHDLPGRIGHFAGVTRGQLGSADSIIRHHTILPYYLPFASRVDEQAVFSTMAGSSIGGLKFQLGLLTSRFRANHPLKACLACMEVDRVQWATSYWRVQHQLPGVWVCLEHGELLVQSSLKATGVGRFQWLLPSASHMQPHASGCQDIDTLSSLARLAIALWAMPAGMRFDPADVTNAYRVELRNKGLLRGQGPGRLSLNAIGQQYAAFVGPLRRVDGLHALPGTPEDAAREVGRLTYEPRSGHHPLRHLAMIEWLFGSMDGFVACVREHLQSSDPRVRSSNVVQEAGPKDNRHSALSALVASGSSVSAASRAIGVDPHTGMAWLTSEGVTTNKRPSRMKEDARHRMIAALKRGAAKADVAELGTVSIESVTRLLRTEVGLREAWKSAKFAKAQRHARATWSKLIAANSMSGVKAMRMLRPDIYAWLYRNDRDWLETQLVTCGTCRTGSGMRVNWDNRDRELASKIEQVALDLASEVPGRRLKLWQIYQKVSELKAKLGHLDRLPFTQLAIQAALRADTKYAGNVAVVQKVKAEQQ